MLTLDQILKDLVVIDNFVTDWECDRLVEAYSQVRPYNSMVVHTDNRVDLQYLDVQDRQLAASILIHTCDKINELYNPNPKVHIDMGGLFARIPGNICDLHADNVMMSCPNHGSNQNNLRDVMCECKDARYVPNHTSYRQFTGLLYLDNNHAGGDIIFQDGLYGKTYRKQIEAIRGRIVISPNNEFFYHETTMVTSGVRYSMNMWFTSNSEIQPIMP